MAVIWLAFDPNTQPQPVRPETEQHARLLAVLIACAKTLQAANKIAEHDSDVQVFTKRIAPEMADLLVSLVCLYGRDGKRMEAETIALATHLQFNIEQRFLAQCAGGVH